MIEMFASAQAAGSAAARLVAEHLASGVAHRGRAGLVVTGGRAPGPAYDDLHAAKLDWTRVVVTLSDERCVEADSADANARLVRHRLLNGRPGRAAFVPLWDPGRDADPEAAASAVEPAVRALLPFDAVMLGMGEDGHVASLIPGTPGLAAALDPEGERLAIGVPAGLGSPPLPRVSLTMAALSHARIVLLLIAGDAKRQVVEQAQAGADLPVGALLRQARAPVRILWSPRHEEPPALAPAKTENRNPRGS